MLLPSVLLQSTASHPCAHFPLSAVCYKGTTNYVIFRNGESVVLGEAHRCACFPINEALLSQIDPSNIVVYNDWKQLQLINSIIYISCDCS